KIDGIIRLGVRRGERSQKESSCVGRVQAKRNNSSLRWARASCLVSGRFANTTEGRVPEKPCSFFNCRLDSVENHRGASDIIRGKGRKAVKAVQVAVKRPD